MKHSFWIAFVYALMSCALVATAHAEEEDLLAVTSDQTTVKKAEVEAMVEDGQVTGMFVYGHSYNLQQLHEGVAVFKKGPVSVLILQGDINPNTETGNFKITYLSKFSVFGSTYSSCPFRVRRRDDRGAWYVQNVYTGDEVKEIKVIASSSGVETLENICR